MPRNSNTLQIIAALTFVSAVTAASNTDCPSDPYADPSTDTCNPLRYVPNKILNIVAACLYFAVGIALALRAFRQPAKYFLCLVIGAWCEGLGFVLRLVFREHLHSIPLYAVCNLFIVLSPCAFLAGDYIILGRLVNHLEKAEHLRPLQPRLVSKLFIWSDVITFLIQAAGGSLSTSTSNGKLGGYIFLAGIAAQMASFLFFTCVWIMFGLRARKDNELWTRKGWKPLYWALGFTCIFFIIRSVYRTVELSQGYTGYLATHEVYFLSLDSLPLILGIATYIFFWPGAYIDSSRGFNKGLEPTSSTEMALTGSTSYPFKR